MNNLTISVSCDPATGRPGDEVADRVREVQGLRPDMLTVDFSAVRTADATWLAMLHLLLLDVEDRGALVLLDGIPSALASMLEATGMHTAFFCRYVQAASLTELR